ncbi:MAG TPA: uroporphyrinogen-III C-methyltransferase [Nevskiaceae bacterium]|nr:uroporphyrinogen-III C-methyltransferase [Nevskiaceae bacterium]
METEPVTPPASAPPPTPRRRGIGSFLVWLVVLALLGAGGWYGWQWGRIELARMHERDQEVASLVAESRQLRAKVDALAQEQSEDLASAKKDIAELKQQMETSGAAISKIAETVQGGRTRVQLAAIEQVLLMANDRALLAHDADGAAQALAQADERLAALNEPKLFKVREAIAQERAALGAVPKPDVTAAALSLSSLIQQMPAWPLQGKLPNALATSAQLSMPPEGYAWPMRLWLSLKEALRSIFILRRDDNGARLLAPEQETLIMQIGLLKLEGARLALLRANTPAFRDLCAASSKWLGDYFETRDPGVLAARAELDKLKALDLTPPLPDLTKSLELLRAGLAAPAS